ncbi:MFS transporter [Nonomuraea sediminis]|uniref:MFS transporter n=1 Tax=Nonomuraea sediminis TaxID=2835864 RepID=UPI001BDC14A1|nr:MFS transporter [Nonomuraea sediminis]
MNAGSARRRYLLVSFLTWLPAALSMAVMVLLMTERGLSLAEIGLATTVFSVVTIGLELPTGGLADVVGRRAVLAVSAAVSVVAMVLMAFSTTLWMFLVTGVLKGIARALSSGPADAWYVDTLHRIEGPDADLKPGLAGGSAMGSVALALGVLAGGFVPLAVPEKLILPLAVPPLLGAGAAAVLLAVVVVAMPEPQRGRRTPAGVLREVPATVVAGARMALGRGLLRRLMLAAVATGVALTAVELLTPGRLAGLTSSPTLGSSAYAVVAALGFAGSALGSAAAPRLARLTRGSVRGAMAGIVVTATSLAALAASAGLAGLAGIVAAALAYVAMFAGLSAGQVLCMELTHKAVTAAERTTLTSVASLAQQAGGALSNLLFGVLAGLFGTAAAWSVAAVVVLASAGLFVRMPATSRAADPAARSATGSRASG